MFVQRKKQQRFWKRCVLCDITKGWYSHWAQSCWKASQSWGANNLNFSHFWGLTRRVIVRKTLRKGVWPDVDLFKSLWALSLFRPSLPPPSPSTPPPLPSWLTSNFLRRRHFEIQFVFGPFKDNTPAGFSRTRLLCAWFTTTDANSFCIFTQILSVYCSSCIHMYTTWHIRWIFVFWKAPSYRPGLNLQRQLRLDLGDKAKM